MTQHFDTRIVHSYKGDKETGATSPPIYQTTAFAHETAEEISDIFNNRKGGYTYSRIANPTVVSFENSVSTIENGVGSVAVSTGMAAIAIAIQALIKAGEEMVVGKSLFGGTYYLFKEFESQHDIKVRFVDPTNIKEITAAVSKKTRLIFCETIGNPKIDVPDIAAIASLAKKHNIPFLVDSTTATPYMINLKKCGVSVSIMAATKWLGGQGTTLGGVITDLGNYQWTQSPSKKISELSKKSGNFSFLMRCKKLRSNMGSSMSPLDAFMLMSGMETLALRFEKQTNNALKIATFLDSHPKVSSVIYPGLSSHPQHSIAAQQFQHGFGSILCFTLEDKKACFSFINALSLIKNLANLGDNKTLAIHPDSTIYRDLSREEKDAAGAKETTIRLSIGIENPKDLIQDIQQALENAH